MRLPFYFQFVLVLIAAGCAAQPKKQVQAMPATSANNAARTTNSSSARNSADSKLIVTPDPVLTGRVVSSNATGRFVVLNFPVGHLPALEQRLDLYRQGIKIGEVKVTGPQRDDHVVADVTAGEAQPGDEVRAR